MNASFLGVHPSECPKNTAKSGRNRSFFFVENCTQITVDCYAKSIRRVFATLTACIFVGGPCRVSSILRRTIRGKCFCSVQDRDATTSCAQCHTSQTGTYAVGHDRGMMKAMERLLGGFTGSGDQQVRACQIASLPMRLGRLDMRSTGRVSQAAHWASWARCAPHDSATSPATGRTICHSLVLRSNWRRVFG